MKKSVSFLLLALVVSSCGTTKKSSIPGETAQRFHVKHKQVLSSDYLLHLPNGYDAHSGRCWPLILFLHGSGECGTNVWLVAKHGPPKVAPKMTNFPFIVVSPQCSQGERWTDEGVLALLNEVEHKYAVDLHRVYLTGLSIGGFGTWDFGLRHPDRIAAMAPLCGGGETIDIITADSVKLNKIRSLGVWAFHGSKDPTVPLGESEHMVRALKNAGCTDVKLTVYPDVGHDRWTVTYANPQLYGWFLQYSR